MNIHIDLDTWTVSAQKYIPLTEDTQCSYSSNDFGTNPGQILLVMLISLKGCPIKEALLDHTVYGEHRDDVRQFFGGYAGLQLPVLIFGFRNENLCHPIDFAQDNLIQMFNNHLQYVSILHPKQNRWDRGTIFIEELCTVQLVLSLFNYYGSGITEHFPLAVYMKLIKHDHTKLYEWLWVNCETEDIPAMNNWFGVKDDYRPRPLINR